MPDIKTFTVEYWRPIPGFDGRYEVSTLGRVRAEHAAFNKSAWFERTGGLLTARIDRYGYPQVKLTRAGIKESYPVHRLVLLAFVGPQPEGTQGCHNNGIKTDNRVENLRWDTAAANQYDKRRHGTLLHGERHPKSRLTAEQVRVIRSSPESELTLAKAFGVSTSNIGEIRRGHSWKGTPEPEAAFWGAGLA
jgi:hypothetical protein